MIPVQLVATHMLSACGSSVHIRIKLTTQVNGIVHFRNLDTQVHREVLPIHRISDKVISATYAQVINDAIHLIWFFARCIFIIAQFHFQVITQRERQTGRTSPTRSLTKTGIIHHLKDRQTILIQFRHYISCLIAHSHHLIICTIKTAITFGPHRVTKIGMVVKTNRWRHHMTETVHLIAEPLAKWDIESIQLC